MTPEVETLLAQLREKNIHMAVSDDATVEDVLEAVRVISEYRNNMPEKTP